MNVGDERSRSVWMNVAVAPDAKRLEGDASADTVVVGSGIAGLSTAYELAARGQTVMVLDRGAIGSGMTARTTAHLTSLCDDSFDSLISKRGVDVAKQFYLSQASAIDRIEKIQGNESIECDFRRLDGYFVPGAGE
jgi:glycine/D-amino acid oxidase-like deaminating enzyme